MTAKQGQRILALEGLLDEAQRWRVERAAGALLPVLARRAAEA